MCEGKTQADDSLYITFSVCCREVSNYKVGHDITLTLMKKEKGSIYAVPANLWEKQTNKCHSVQGT